MSIEAGELLEYFQWSDKPRDGDWGHMYEELADVLDVDLDEIILSKMAKTPRNTQWKRAAAPARKRSETTPTPHPPARIPGV